MSDKKKFFIFIGSAVVIVIGILLIPKMMKRHNPVTDDEYGAVYLEDLDDEVKYNPSLYEDSTSFQEELTGVEISGKDAFSEKTPAECILYLDERLQKYLDYYLQEPYIGTAKIIPHTVEEEDPNAITFTIHLDNLDENVYCTYLIYRRRFRFSCVNIEATRQ